MRSKNVYFIILILIISVFSVCSVTYGLDIVISGSVNEMYDDNITFKEKDEKKDLITNLIMGLGIKYEGQTKDLEFISYIKQQIFANYYDYNNTSQYLNFNYFNELSQYDNFKIKNIFIHDVEPRSFEDQFGDTGGRYTYNRNRFNFTYSKELTDDYLLIARYYNQLYINTRSDIRDSYFNNTGLEAKYILGSSTFISILYDFAHTNFEPGATASVHRGTLTFRHNITYQLYFDCKAGMDFIETFTNKNYTKPYILGSLIDDIDPNSQIRIIFIKEYDINSYSQDISNSWQISFIFTRQLLERLLFSFSTFYGYGKYISRPRTDKLIGIDFSFSYDIKEKIKGILRYRFSKRKSSTNSNGYVKNNVLFGITMEF